MAKKKKHRRGGIRPVPGTSIRVLLVLLVLASIQPGCSDRGDDPFVSEKLSKTAESSENGQANPTPTVTPPAAQSPGTGIPATEPSTKSDNARRLKDDGSFLLSSGDHAGAIKAFKAAKVAGGHPGELDPLIEKAQAEQAKEARRAKAEEDERRRQEEARREEEERRSRLGGFTAESSRTGVGVYLDGSLVGRTPITLRNVPQGQHTLEWRVGEHSACTRSFQVGGGTEQTFHCEAPEHIYRARLSDRDHHNSKGVRLKSADGIIRQDRAWVHRFDKIDPEDEVDLVFSSGKMRGRMEGMLAQSLSSEDKRRILNSEPLIEVWIWDHSLDVRFVD